jgi:uncharacterized protein (TIGR03437 family)
MSVLNMIRCSLRGSAFILLCFAALSLCAGSASAQCDMTFNYTIGQALPQAQVCQLTTTAPVSFTAVASTPWIQVSPTSGTLSTVPTDLTVSVAPTGNTAGNYGGSVTVSGPDLAASTFMVTLVVSSGAPPGITVTTPPALPAATADGSYSVVLTASGGVPPYQWSAAVGSSLPPGLTLSVGGVLSGTITQAGAFTFSISVTDSSGSVTVFVFTLAVSAQQGGGSVPSINAGGVVSAASFVAPVVPGSIASTFGTFLLTSPLGAASSPLPTSLEGLSLQFGGSLQAPLFFVSGGQVNLQVPWELAGQSQATITGTLNDQTGPGQAVALAAFAPGILSMNAQGTGQGAILDASYRLVDSSNPAIPGTTAVQIFCTGLGAVTNQPRTGAPALSSPLSETTTTPTVSIGDIPAKVIFSGLAPGFVGEYQVNAIVPNSAPGGSAVPVAIGIGGAVSNAVTIAVQGTSVPTLADLTLSATANPHSVTGGGTITYTLTIQNIGTATADSVTLTDPLPAGASFLSCAASTGDCVASTSTVTASLGALAPGTTVNVVIMAAAPSVTSSTVITDTASISTTSRQSSTANNQASASATVVPATSSFAITSLSNSSSAPLTALQIGTNGINVNAPVSVQFSNGSGYSVTEPAVRVAPDGTVVAGVPFYVDPTSRQITTATVSVAIMQGASSTAGVPFTIQDLPPVSAYGTTPGQITHAMLVFEAILIGQRLNQLQSFQLLSGNSVDTTQAQNTLNTLLNAVIQARSDVDNVTLNNSLVISNGALADGTPIQFDASSLDMMDRVNAQFLTQTLAAISTSASPQAFPRSQAVRVVSSFKRSQLGSAVLMASGGLRTLLNRSEPSTTRRLHHARLSRHALLNRQASTSADLNNLLALMEDVNGAKELTDGAAQAADAQTWTDTVQAAATAGSGTLDLLHDESNIAKDLGLVGAILSDVRVVGDTFGQLGAYIDGEATGNQALVDVAVQAMRDSRSNLYTTGVDLALALAGGPSAAEALQNTSTVANFVKTIIELGDSSQTQVDDTSVSLVNEVPSLPAGEIQGFANVTGTVDVSNSGGITSAQSGVELSSNGIQVFTMADANGKYLFAVPVQIPGFDYTSGTIQIVDPISGTPLGSEIVNLSPLAPGTTIQAPPVTGTCIDDDANNPDSDDPDCDN